jgi:hypothetical protein
VLPGVEIIIFDGSGVGLAGSMVDLFVVTVPAVAVLKLTVAVSCLALSGARGCLRRSRPPACEVAAPSPVPPSCSGYLLRANHDIAIGQRARRLERRTLGGDPADREVVGRSHWCIAHDDRGVIDGSTVSQAARAGDNSLVPRDPDSIHPGACHVFAGVRFVKVHFAGRVATIRAFESEAPPMPVISLLVAVTFGIVSSPAA